MNLEQRFPDDFLKLANTTGVVPSGESVWLCGTQIQAVVQKVLNEHVNWIQHELKHNGLLTAAGIDSICERAKL